MNHRRSIPIILVALAFVTGLWTLEADARLYPPCQNINYAWGGDLITLRYWVSDPITGQTQEETYSLEVGAAHSIESVQADQGILTWIAKYRAWGETDYTYEVHYRLYDPGRGAWRGGFWGPFTGYGTWLGQHQVKDGVVAWTAHQSLGPNPTDPLEHQVIYATYDPSFGSFVWDRHFWQVGYLNKYSPEVLRVRNGVVAWPMNKSDSGQCSGEDAVEVYCTIYDQELQQWQNYRPDNSRMVNFDWINIPDDTLIVDEQFWSFYGSYENHHYFPFYDPNTHQWNAGFGIEYDSAIRRRAFFVVWPSSGVTPFITWLWDCSFALDGATTQSAWLWESPRGVTFGYPNDRSTWASVSSPRQYTITERIFYENYTQVYSSSQQINAVAPVPPTGGISINNDAHYTNSTNVSLSIHHDAGAVEMCFRQYPGLLLWSGWEPVANSKSWILSTLHVQGQPPDGPHTVSVKFRDQYGNESAIYEDTIDLVITPPAGSLTLNNGAVLTRNPMVTATWSAQSNYGMQMSYCYYNEGDSFYMWSSWESYQPFTKTFKFNSKPGRKTVMARFRDDAKNITQVQSSIQLQSASLPFLLWLLE